MKMQKNGMKMKDRVGGCGKFDLRWKSKTQRQRRVS